MKIRPLDLRLLDSSKKQPNTTEESSHDSCAILKNVSPRRPVDSYIAIAAVVLMLRTRTTIAQILIGLTSSIPRPAEKDLRRRDGCSVFRQFRLVDAGLMLDPIPTSLLSRGYVHNV